MDPKASLPCSQKPAIGPYPQSDEPNSHPHTLFLILILILFSHLRLGFPIGLFSSEFPMKILYAFPIPYVLATMGSRIIFLGLITQVMIWCNIVETFFFYFHSECYLKYTVFLLHHKAIRLIQYYIVHSLYNIS
jgi:hypothetical protein